MGVAQSKQDTAKPTNGLKTDTLKWVENCLTESDRATKMPSIEQCEASSGSVAALPSTIELFDKFKVLSSVSGNDKDSDSEESFHLPLDDDDMENQSVVSNGRDKEIHNEETEDDILNKFETVPSGTPDNIDSHIEDSILEENDSKDSHEYNYTSKKVKELTSHIEEPCDSKTKIELKLTYDFEGYEDSADGEFKSIYETDQVVTESEVEEPQEESTKHVTLMEPMEIAEESDSVECIGEEIKEPQCFQNVLQKVVAGIDSFDDSMEVEQEDTNQNIANIIEKLEDQDTPMKNVNLNDEDDVNMVESSDDKTVMSINTDKSEKLLDASKFIPENKAAAEENNEDVEMINIKPPESYKENMNQVGNNEPSEVTATFQEPLEDSTEAYSGEAQEPIILNTEEKCSDDAQFSEGEKSENVLEEEAAIGNNNGHEKAENTIESNESVQSNNPTASSTVGSDTELGPEDIEKSPKTPSNFVDESVNIDYSEADILDVLSKPEIDASSTVSQLNDELLQELDKTINESETTLTTKEDTESDKIFEDTGTELLQESETHEKEFEKNEEEPNKAPSTDDGIFKTPVEVFKSREEKDPDLQNEISNSEDESDLLDISMVRETEEDDACAIADALNDKDAQVSEKSDEEQSEKVETEQEGSDVDKDNDNDNDPVDFDDTDDDSHMDGVELDDSSNAESANGKIANISESSKDSISENEAKRYKKAVITDVSDDCAVLNVPASESGDEPEKMDDSLVPNMSLNLESTLVQDESISLTNEKDAIAPVSSEEESMHKEEDHKTENAKKSQLLENESDNDIQSEAIKSTDNDSERRKSLFNKRTFSTSDIEDAEISAKKPKLSPTVAAEDQVQKEPVPEPLICNPETVEKDPPKDMPTANEKVKTLTGFSKFMQCRQFTAKLSRSDLEQFCIQKICESLMLKSSEGELHQTIKKHEKTIDFLRKDMQQLTKQCKDLEIVNKKLLNELRSQNAQKKPLVPLKITRSVGLQVRLNPGNETSNQNRRRQLNTTPQKPIVNNTSSALNRPKVTPGNVQQPTVVRQVLQNSPQKSPLTTGQTTTNASPTTPLLSQALQQQKPRQSQAIAAKRTTTPVRKPPEVAKPVAKPGGNPGAKPGGNPGVIDLTDEDDRLAATRTVAGSTIKIINKTALPNVTANKTLLNKIVPGKAMANQGKQIGIQKTVTVGQNKGNTLSQGIRLTPTSVITSNGNGSPQMVYVVPTITSNAGGTQKVAFVNFQPTNGVLSGTLNGSTVSVMSNKGQTLTLKTVPSPMRQKHPAPLPPLPRIAPDPKLKSLLPKPHLTIKKIDTGIILQWKMPYNLEQYESIASYQLYAYQETSSAPSTDMWRKVGDVKALALPMACTLTQFADKNKYYFAVRSVDVHKRIGAFSDPEEISL